MSFYCSPSLQPLLAKVITKINFHVRFHFLFQKGVVNCSLIAMERMGKHKNGKGGTIVNVASVCGLHTYPALPIYNATKFGVFGFTKSLKVYTELDVKLFSTLFAIVDG